jgi:hypothetical protein
VPTPKKEPIEYDETAHKIAYCKRQIYYFSTKPNLNLRLLGYFMEELKELEESQKIK